MYWFGERRTTIRIAAGVRSGPAFVYPETGRY